MKCGGNLGIDAVLPTFQYPNCGKLLVCQSTDIKEPKTAKKRFLAFFRVDAFFPYFDRTIKMSQRGRLSADNMNRAIGMLQAGCDQCQVATTFNVSQSVISRMWIWRGSSEGNNVTSRPIFGDSSQAPWVSERHNVT